MPRFTVPVLITLSAKDAHHAHNTVEGSSVTSLEIPGLRRIAVKEPIPLSRKPRRVGWRRPRQTARQAEPTTH